MSSATDLKPKGDQVEAAAGPASLRPRWKRAGAMAGAVMAVLALLAYAAGWIGDTGLLFVGLGFVVWAKAAYGGFG